MNLGIAGEPAARVFDYEYHGLHLNFGANGDRSTRLGLIQQRVAGIRKQIYEELLQLNSITPDGRQLVGQLE